MLPSPSKFLEKFTLGAQHLFTLIAYWKAPVKVIVKIAILLFENNVAFIILIIVNTPVFTILELKYLHDNFSKNGTGGNVFAFPPCFLL